MALLYRCNNCDWETDDPNAVKQEIPDLYERLESGDIFPEGTCPACGCFVHRYDEEYLMKMAAPELLDACVWFDNDIEPTDKGFAEWYADAVCRVRDAIAKATGMDGMDDDDTE